MKEENNNTINCFQCVHFVVTWEPDYPRSCKLFGFKSKTQPSVAVYEATGSVCMGFEKKTHLTKF